MRASPPSTANAEIREFPRSRLSDADLVRALASGDARSLDALWGRYSVLVRRVIARSLGTGPDLEDLTQEVFLALVRSAPRMRDTEAVRPLVLGIACRQVALEIRRRQIRRWVRLSPTGELPVVSSPADDHEGREALQALRRILDGLGPRERVAFVLRHGEDLTVPEVAEALGVSESTAKRAIVSAVRTITEQAKDNPALAPYLERLDQKEHHRAEP